MSIQDNVTVNGRVYTFYTMPPTEAFPLVFSFFNTFGKSLAPLVAKGDDPDETTVAQLVESLSQGKANQVLQLFHTVFRYVRQDGCTISLDDHFSGRNKELLKVFFYALVFNFSDFLDESLLASVIDFLQIPSSPRA